jgi:hypothetical protein
VPFCAAQAWAPLAAMKPSAVTARALRTLPAALTPVTVD